jgi:hypothetical protein
MNRINKKKRMTKKKKVGGRKKSATRKLSLKLKKTKEDAVVDVDKMFSDLDNPTIKKKSSAVVDVDEMFPDLSSASKKSKPSKSLWERKSKSNRQIVSNKSTRKSVSVKPKKTNTSKNVDEIFAYTPKKNLGAVVDIDEMFPELPPTSVPVPLPPILSKFDNAYWLNVYDEYLDDVLFGEKNEKELKNEIMEKSFGPNTYFVDLFQKIKSVLPEKEKNKKWVDCVNECFSQTHDNVMQEIGSTAYMLRVLTKSVVGDTENNKIVFSLDNKENLTGKWENDKEYFKMKIERLDGSRKVCKGRLIMGFGPSASGKTYCANKVIELMSSIDNEFPKFFITVDGGVFREESVVYQTIIKAVGEKGVYDGLKNLVSASALSLQQSIFESNIIKKTMKQYLREQKENNKFVVSLYVPETLGGCIRNTVFTMVDCSKSYKDYIDITNDKDWIGLMIYQHKEHSDCPYKEDYKCKGTTESGKSREKTEGKKYSSSAWDNSYKNGNYSIAQAKTYRFRIHNSGRLNGITVFEDLSPKKIDISNQTISKFFKDSNWQYIDDKVKYNSDCEKYSNKCSKAKSRSNSDSSVE